MQTHVLRVELGQGLLGLDPVAHLHQAAGDLAADAEGQFRLQPGAHFARVGHHRVAGGLRLHHHGRAYRLLDGLVIAAGTDEQRECQRQSEGQDMAEHGV